MDINLKIFQIVVLIFSAIIHEYMHGWMAFRLGDSTAKDMGRLSLNPLVHMDPFGSFLLPFLMIISGSSFVFGWAKPVPYNPHNLKDQKWGGAKVALAGPLGNLITAIFFGLMLRFMPFFNLYLMNFLAIIVYINLILMVFNLIPIPPLDGSKIIAPLLSSEARQKYLSIERYGMFIILLFLGFGFSIVLTIVQFLFRIIVG